MFRLNQFVLVTLGFTHTTKLNILNTLGVF